MSDYTIERSLFEYLFASFLNLFHMDMVSYWIDVANAEVVFTIRKINDDTEDRMNVRIGVMCYHYGHSYVDSFADFFRQIMDHYHLDWKSWVELLQKRGLV